ncbi:MAG: hypothetical protein ACRD5G_00880, partial [Candidatus Acidiferrales bacterium]
KQSGSFAAALHSRRSIRFCADRAAVAIATALHKAVVTDFGTGVGREPEHFALAAQAQPFLAENFVLLAKKHFANRAALRGFRLRLALRLDGLCGSSHIHSLF